MRPIISKTIMNMRRWLCRYPRVFLLLCLALISGNIFEEMVDDVFFDPLEGDYESEAFDQFVFNYLRDFESPQFTEVMRDLTSIGSTSVIGLLGLVTGLILLIHKKMKDLLYLMIVCAGAPVLIVFLKSYFHRERPPAADWLVDFMPGLSFPSGHSFGAATIYFALAYILASRIKYWPKEIIVYAAFFLLILAVGVSRIYLGVHYATDVIAGISSGLIWVSLVSIVFEVYSHYQLRKT